MGARGARPIGKGFFYVSNSRRFGERVLRVLSLYSGLSVRSIAVRHLGVHMGVLDETLSAEPNIHAVYSP
jgi:hypothetical protein